MPVCTCTRSPCIEPADQSWHHRSNLLTCKIIQIQKNHDTTTICRRSSDNYHRKSSRQLYLKVEIQSETGSKVQVRQAPRRNPITDHTREKQLLQKSAQQTHIKLATNQCQNKQRPEIL